MPATLAAFSASILALITSAARFGSLPSRIDRRFLSAAMNWIVVFPDLSLDMLAIFSPTFSWVYSPLVSGQVPAPDAGPAPQLACRRFRALIRVHHGRNGLIPLRPHRSLAQCGSGSCHFARSPASIVRRWTPSPHHMRYLPMDKLCSQDVSKYLRSTRKS